MDGKVPELVDLSGNGLSGSLGKCLKTKLMFSNNITRYSKGDWFALKPLRF